MFTFEVEAKSRTYFMRLILVFCSVLSFGIGAQAQCEEDFKVPDGYTWIVPAGVTSIQIKIAGASGGNGGQGGSADDGSFLGGSGGNGARDGLPDHR